MAAQQTRHHAPLVGTGRRIQVDDWVRVVGVPDFSGWTPEGRAESLPVFEYLVGKYKRFRGFDRYGHVELGFRMGPSLGIHWVWIEPHLLRVRRTRNPRAR